MKKKIIIAIALVLVVIQFFGIDKENPSFEAKNDFITVTNPPELVKNILKNSCYDCHSNETEYPWYTNVAPVSWWIKHHINEGRDELNFSEWATFELKRKKHKLDEMVEMVEEGEMPLDSYTWAHSEATLSDEQKTALIDWTKSLQ
ncbi:MAG: heme-binding domain-containing protein [Cyclobacteriaceae bacterium]|nr:heme-binding domain-containing protein [Cyclobacteriaceae bacterium]